jgi:fructokinase
MAAVVCLGELLVDLVPTVTPTTLQDAPAFEKAAGGAPANVAVGLARLGTTSAFMGKVGNDPFGRFLARTLEDAGVDTLPLRFTDRARTALAFVSLRADGEREFLFYRQPSADMLLEPADLDERAFEGAGIFHYGSISLIAEPCRSATLEAIRIALRRGLLLSCDPNLRLPLWPDAAAARAGMRDAIAQAEIVKLSQEEVHFLTGTDDPQEGGARLLGPRTRLLVVTRGAAGCLLLGQGGPILVPGFAVEAIDTTGAGDGFVAGLLDGILRNPGALADGSGLAGIARFATAMGALTTTRRGAIPALPTRAEVEAFLATAPKESP